MIDECVHGDNSKPINLLSSQESLIQRSAGQADLKKRTDELNDQAKQVKGQASGTGLREEAGARPIKLGTEVTPQEPNIGPADG